VSNFVSREPVKVTIAADGPDSEWVSIKPKMSVGDRGTLSDRIMHVSTAGGTTDVDVKAGQYLLAMLEVNIVDWRLLDDAGQPVPFKKDMIAGLDPDSPLIDAVLGEIAKRNPTLSGASATTG
jgi:hypothetical protein